MSYDKTRHERLLDLIVEALTEDSVAAEADLKKKGVDLDAAVNAHEAIFQKLKSRVELEAAREELERRDAESERFGHLIRPKLEALSLTPQQFLARMQDQGRVSMSFSSLEVVSDEDAIDIIEEAGLLPELERLESESSGQ